MSQESNKKCTDRSKIEYLIAKQNTSDDISEILETSFTNLCEIEYKISLSRRPMRSMSACMARRRRQLCAEGSFLNYILLKIIRFLSFETF